jgi:predicted dehydrogenase
MRFPRCQRTARDNPTFSKSRPLLDMSLPLSRWSSLCKTLPLCARREGVLRSKTAVFFIFRHHTSRDWQVGNLPHALPFIFMRLAVVGLGFMGSVHVKALRSLPGVELAAVVSRREDFTGVAGNLGGSGEALDLSGVRRYCDVAEALADPEIDAVDLCLPTDLHEPIAIDALRHGKHVLVEKPMALDVASCERMIDEARRHGRVLMVAQVLRFFPAYRALEETMRDVGPVRGVIFRRRCARPSWSDWLAVKARSGGGVFDLLIHDVDMALHLFGTPVEIAASGYEDLAVGIDTISAQLFYSGGLTVEIAGGWHNSGTFPFSMEYTVVADGGTLDYNSESRPPRLHGANGLSEELPLVNQDGYSAEIAYFAECCRDGAAPARCPPEESARAVSLALAIIEARKRNGEKHSWVTSKSA